MGQFTGSEKMHWRRPKKRSLADFFRFVSAQDFKLTDRKGHTVEFYVDPNRYVCLCCGRLRVKVDGERKCLDGIRYYEGVYAPNAKPCSHSWRGEGCDPESCAAIAVGCEIKLTPKYLQLFQKWRAVIQTIYDEADSEKYGNAKFIASHLLMVLEDHLREDKLKPEKET